MSKRNTYTDEFKTMIAEVTPNFNKNTMYGKIRYIVDSPINYLKDKNLILILTYASKLVSKTTQSP
ncbi:hypothetical protein [Schnuerera ultunensis]|uniref:Uncharacterized protein n=1 Tax=[Clostridium] ultunense Esp TaxID=1288971 RepID=A0A1M4PJQ8_9FIRM|nr:hypothetical protein [Schnuerera ultunensis]SHD75685.1 protein of unknown function [[Clostridium] ultunense Esp]SHD75688.1 protein of unknown function [[Clostridium] ultunense Esp]